MSETTFLDLDSLPPPKVVEPLSFEQLFQRKLTTLVALDPGFNALLESDPAIKLLEADAYDELILRARINDAARARLLAFAEDSDLDQLAAFYGVTRLAGELDPSLKIRVREAIMGRSAAGTRAQYRFAALSASLDVSDCEVDSPAGGIVRVSVLSRLGDGTPSADLLADVAAVVQSDSVRALNDTVQVVAAEIIPFDVEAQVWLTPTAPQAVFDGLPDVLRTEFAASRRLGFNVAPSWITAKLQQSGVQRVLQTSPSVQLTVAPYQCAALRNINLVYAGRDY